MSFRAEISLRLLDDTALEIWGRYVFCGIAERELLLILIIIAGSLESAN